MLTPADRKELRARAHHLNPVVMIGEAGLTEAVLAEARRAIAVHELIKIRVLGDDRDLRSALMQQLCEALACAPVQMIGKLLVVYRPRPADEDAARSARPRGPHVPKKAAAAGKTAASFKPRRAPSAKAAPRAAEPAAGKRVWSTEATGRPSTRVKRAAAGTQGPRGLQGKPGARTAGPRARSTRKR